MLNGGPQTPPPGWTTPASNATTTSTTTTESEESTTNKPKPQGSTFKPVPDTTTSGTVDLICGSTAGLKPDPQDCSMYYFCSLNADLSWNKQHYQCTSGLLFNPNFLVCDWKNNVKCDQQVRGVHASFPDDVSSASSLLNSLCLLLPMSCCLLGLLFA